MWAIGIHFLLPLINSVTVLQSLTDMHGTIAKPPEKFKITERSFNIRSSGDERTE